ncbi:MAG: hypothetical protein ACRENC_03175 [Gemmatimonadaceae bacterium]
MSFAGRGWPRVPTVGQSRARAHIVVLGLACLCAPAGVHAQTSNIVLRIKPKVGDTLFTRFEQDVSMKGTVHVRGSDTTMTMHTSLLLLSRVLVQGSDETGTTITTITDSVSLISDGEPSEPEDVRRAMEGQRVQLHIAPDGSAVVLALPPQLSADIRAVVSGMPATLPDKPVSVSQSWQRVTMLPLVGESAGKGVAATLRATYRLDSLSSDGTLAFVSMRGTITRDPGARPLANGLRVTSSGKVTGMLCVDRKRGWWIDARATIALVSTLVPVAGASATPVRMQTEITQHMHTASVR